jgi:type IV pilus assembly protein PilB
VTSADDLVLQLIEDAGLVNSESIATARAQAESEGAEEVDAKAIDLLVANGYITVQKILETLGNEFGMDVVDLNDIRVSNEALETLPLELAQRFNAFPLEVDGNEIQIAVSDLIDVDTIDSLGHILKMTVNPRLAPAADILASIERYYEGARVSEVDAMFSEMGEGDASVVLPTGEEKDVSAEEAPIIRYVHMVITEAIKRRASDIHLEPLEKRFRVRYRIDGVLQEMENPPKRLQPSIISRLKLMANISIAEKRTPQDGRIQMKSGRKEVDLRVSSLPTVFGESIVMRN